jgi:hypothetical protein
LSDPGATPRTPPLAGVRDVLATLDRAGIVAALGGSGLLAALGLSDRVGDWDVTTDAAVDDVAAALAGEPHERFGSSGIHADHKLVLRGGEIEVICRFALDSPAGVCRVPTIVTRVWRDLPVGSPVGWAIAYELLHRGEEPEHGGRVKAQTRAEKAERLWRHVEQAGVTLAEREALATQPLPMDLRRRHDSAPGQTR